MLKSVEKTTIHEIIINKSRFIGIIEPIDDVDMVPVVLKHYQEVYPDATHYCYAYIIGPHEKANDNGEPSGTAGLPMLGVLQKNELQNVLAIVIRYFGGIKLGAGGLVRAYTQATSQALEQGEIVVKEKTPYYAFSFAYPYIGQIDHLLKTRHIPVCQKHFEMQVTYECYVPDPQLFDAISDLTRGQYEKELIRYAYIKKQEVSDE